MARNGHGRARAAIRVAFVIGSAEVGGAEHLMLSLMRRLSTDEFECSIICPSSGPLVARYAEVAVRVGTVGQRSFLNPVAILRIAALLRRWRIEVVHTCLYGSDAGGILAARLAGVPRVISHIVGHNFYVTEEQGWRLARKRLWSWMYRGVYALSDQLIAVSEAVKRDLVCRGGIKVPAAKIVIIRHALSGEETLAVSAKQVEEVKRRYGIPEGSVVIATIASLIPLKGHRYLIEALPGLVRSVPSLRCLLVGDGPHRPAVEQLVRRLRLTDHVVLTGVLDDARRNAILQLSRVVVLPSLSEGLPVSLLEAMAFGKPVVATAAGGIGEVVDDGVTGLLVPPRDPHALASALRQVLSDDALAERMGRAGRRRIEEVFPMNALGGRMRELYRALVPSATPLLIRQHGYSFGIPLSSATARICSSATG